MDRILIEHGIVIPVDGTGRSHRQGWVLVEQGRIAALGGGEAPAHDGARRIDASGMAVLPGLVDAHTHLSPTGLFRSLPEDLTEKRFLGLVTPMLDRHVTDDDLHAGARLAALECLKGGTTATNELGLPMDPVARAVEEIGLRCALGPDVSDVAGLSDDGTGRHVHDPALGETALGAAEDVHRRWHGAADGRLTVRFTNFSPVTCSPAFLQKTRALADRYGVGLNIHALSTPDKIPESQAVLGGDVAVALRDLGYLRPDVSVVHFICPTDADIEAMAESGATMVQCPMAYAKAGHAAPVGRIRAAGIPIAAGSDWLAMDMFQQIRCAMVLARLDAADSPVVDSHQGLAMGTILAARALGLGDEIGSLEVGKRADIILVDLDQPHMTPHGRGWDPVKTVVHTATGRDVAMVLVDGKVVVENRRALTVDEREVMATGTAHAEAVLVRAGVA